MTWLGPIAGAGLRYNHIVGTGGIGSGIFFALSGDHTLGRNESRAGTLLPYHDFCKQHIILHYISVLLGAKPGGNFQAFPIGAVGEDDIGKKLVIDIQLAGMDTRNITISQECSTLFSVCFQYPDHTGGNISTDDSASNKVSPESIEAFFREFEMNGTSEIILAAPEVPLETRIKLLQYGRQRGSLNIASILSAETHQFDRLQGFGLVDILSINIDEARSIALLYDEGISSRAVVDGCLEELLAINPTISVLITDGANGSYCYMDNYLEHIPALNTHAISTAGAGDAFLAGTITGICCGLPLVKGTDDTFFAETPLVSAVELGTLLASLSVTSCHTIHPEADAGVLYSYALENDLRLSSNYLKLFKDQIV